VRAHIRLPAKVVVCAETHLRTASLAHCYRMKKHLMFSQRLIHARLYAQWCARHATAQHSSQTIANHHAQTTAI
jgi:hypothetical protein